MSVIIAIDGPAAAGKGTLARRIAAKFGLPYLDTGILYRATARRVLDHGGDPAAAAASLTPADLASPNLRTPEIDRTASLIASIPEVRAALLAFQRDFGAQHGAVLDGRDIGTVIFPDASAKIFVTASTAARAQRRYKEMLGRGMTPDFAEVTRDLTARDEADLARAAAPLKPAQDAMVLDTTELDADAAFTKACEILAEKNVLPPN